MSNKDTFAVELLVNWQAGAASAPSGWTVISRHATREAAIAELERRERQEGRGFTHRITPSALPGFANRIDYSDVTPFEIVRWVSDKSIDIRPMSYERANPEEDLGFRAGGFVGHFAHQERQRWNISSNPAAMIIRIRATAIGQWRDKHGGRYNLADKPRRFFDFNF